MGVEWADRSHAWKDDAMKRLLDLLSMGFESTLRARVVTNSCIIMLVRQFECFNDSASATFYPLFPRRRTKAPNRRRAGTQICVNPKPERTSGRAPAHMHRTKSNTL